MADEPVSSTQALAAGQLLGGFLAGSGLENGPGDSPFPIVFGGAPVYRIDQWGSKENANLFREVDGSPPGGGIPMVYVGLADTQKALFSGQPVLTAVITQGVPAQVPVGLMALIPTRLVDSTLETLRGGVLSNKSARILRWVVAVIIVSALIYVSALQRVRDFAVLKALGPSSAVLLASLCLRAVVVTSLAAVVGVVVSRVLTGIFDQTVAVLPSAYDTLPLVAIAVGVIASLLALRRATGADPAAAFG